MASRRFSSLAARQRHNEGSSRGGIASSEVRRTVKADGMAKAIAWRESRRCSHCGALGYEPCSHRPSGAQ